jgi:hypothetical protein
VTAFQFSSPRPASAQVTEEWVRRYDGPGDYGDEHAAAMAADQAGNVYVTGYGGFSGSAQDIVTIKYSGGGTVLWTQRFNRSIDSWERGNAIAVDQAENVHVTGESETGCVTIKYCQGPVRDRDLLRNTEVTTLDPPPDLSTILPLDPAGDLYIPAFQSDSPDPDGTILEDRTQPLVFYGVNGPEVTRLQKTTAREIRITFR